MPKARRKSFVPIFLTVEVFLLAAFAVWFFGVDDAVDMPEAQAQKILTDTRELDLNDHAPSVRPYFEEGQVVVLYFWAEWCGPCKYATPFVEEQAVKRNGEVVFVKVNVDTEPRIVDYYDFGAMPAILIFSPDGRRRHTVIGFHSRNTGPEVEKKLDQTLGG